MTPEQEGQLRKAAANGLAAAQAELDKKPTDVDHLTWAAYLRLRASVPKQDMLGERLPIPVSEVLSYCDLIGLTDPDQRIRLLDATLAGDAALRDFYGKT